MKVDLPRFMRRKPDRLLEQLQQQSGLVLYGTNALMLYMQEPSKKNAARVRMYEQKADGVRRNLIADLSQTFVTPIDREDLFALSRAIDDILDYATTTVYEIDVLKVAPNRYLQKMVKMLHHSATEIDHAIATMEARPQQANQHVIRAKRLENRMETLHAHAIADLFQKPDDLNEVVNMMKMREIYQHLFRAMQSAEQAADNIGDIIVKFY